LPLSAWLFVVVVGSTVLLSIGGMLLVRRSITLAVLESHNEVAGFIYAVVGVVYAVLLAFTAIVVWEQHADAESVAAQEASELADLYRDAEAFPKEIREQLRGQIRAYSQIVVEREWPAMARGDESPEAWAAFNRLWHTYMMVRPADSFESAWYTQSVDRMNRLGDARRNRLLRLGPAIPGVMWGVLLATGVITIGFTFLFGTKSVWSQAVMVAGLSTTIASVLFLIWILDRPFSGAARIEPESFRQLEAILARWATLR
jgi:Protein of unknown function (DUF4239)